MKVFRLMVMHPRVLPVNQLQSRVGEAQYLYLLPEGPKLRHLQEDLAETRTGAAVPRA